MKGLSIILCLFAFCACSQSGKKSGQEAGREKHRERSSKENLCIGLDGSIFQFKLENSDPDSLAFTIMFHCRADSLQGIIFGPYAAGDEGLYFFKEKMDSIRIDNGILSFSYVQNIYYGKPFTLKNYDKQFPNDILGRGRYREHFRGRLEPEKITLICSGELAPCYADTMVFKRK